MTKADKYMKSTIENILKNGYVDVNPRPKYKDGTPAHTLSVNHNFRSYDLSLGEFPICTLRPIAWKTAIRELFAIYQNQSNKISEFERLGCSWWQDWSLPDGTIGKSYPYNLESHRPNDSLRQFINVEQRLIDEKYKELLPIKFERNVYNVGYLGNYLQVPNFLEYEIQALKDLWEDMLKTCYSTSDSNEFVHQDWHCFENFLRDCRYLPQYHLAKEDMFRGWTIDKNYYRSNAYSKNTSVFLMYSESKSYRGTDFGYRYELSRNQVNELLNSLQTNPYGRRHIISFWNWANINEKALVECAYETIWNVRKGKDDVEYLDMLLIQRSGDMLTASGPGGINEVQYAALLLMVASHTGYKPGVFSHIVANEQIYDRHINAALEMLERCKSKESIENLMLRLLKYDKLDFYSFTLGDFVLDNYEPIKPQLKLELGI